MSPDIATRTTTAEIDGPLRYDAWNSMLREAYGSWDLGPCPAPAFDARLTSRSVGGLQVVDCSCDPHRGVRRNTDVRRDGGETLTLQLVLGGREIFTVDQTAVQLTPGDVLVWTSLQPMSFEVTHHLRKISVTVPLARMQSWFPDLWTTFDTLLPANAPGVGLLGSFIDVLSSSVLNDPSANGEALTESLLGVLRNVVRPGAGAPSNTLGDAQRTRVLQYIDRHLADPLLGPATIAAATQISVRYLHQLFEGEEETVLGHIMAERLRRCRTELQNPAMADRSITEIAFSWGFQDLSHFSRRFRARYGASPREYRRGVLVAGHVGQLARTASRTA